LDDELRQELGDYLRRKKADEMLAEDLEEFAISLEQSEIPRGVTFPSDHEEHLTPAEALEATRRFASEEEGDDDAETFSYYLETTTLLSFAEFRDGVPAELASAVVVRSGETTSTPVANALYGRRGDLYVTTLAATPTASANPRVEAIPSSRFVVWKIADIDGYVPESPDDGREGLDPPLRDRVVEAWQQFHARDAVEARGEQLVEIAKSSAEPFTTLFADTPVIEGEDITVEVSETSPTSKLRWYSSSSAANPFFGPAPADIATIPGFPDVPTGDAFFHTLYRDMDVGDVRAVWNEDYSHLFVVRVNERIPASQEAFLTGVQEAFDAYEQNREIFAQIPQMTPAILQIASRSTGEQTGRRNIFNELFDKYEIVIHDGEEQ
jgi:hypothetical protein